MPEVIMSYELYEGDMISLKRREQLIRCRDCSHYIDSGVKDVRMCGRTLTVLSGKDFCSKAERRSDDT